jgi:hypothetical protein
MDAKQYRELVDKLESIQLNELAYGEEDPKNPGFMWVPADGTTPLGDGSKQMIQTRFGEYWNAKKVPIVKPAPEPTPEPTPEPAPEPTPEPAPEPTPAPEPAPTPEPVQPQPTPVEPCGPEVKEKIKQQKTFNAAYTMARKAGCPDFDWCQIVNVPGPVMPQPAPEAPATTNPMGDYDPTAFNGNPAAYEEGYESDNYILEDELNRVREIAGTQIVQELGPPKTGAIPEIKAASKQAAIEIAQKKGIKQFRFCGKYKVQAGKKTRPVEPPKPPLPPTVVSAPEPVTTNPMGDFDPTAFSGDFTRARR